MRFRTVLRAPTALAAIALPAYLLAAQVPPPADAPGEGPKAPTDALVEATISRWEQLEEHPGRSGITRLECGVKLKGENPIAGPFTTTGRYVFAAGKGTIQWADAELGKLLDARGWSAVALDRWFRPETFRESLAGAGLAAEKTADGVVLRAAAETAAEPAAETDVGYESLHFDADGVLRRIVFRPMEIPAKPKGKKGRPRAGKPTSEDESTRLAGGELSLRHQEVDGRYRRIGWTVGFEGAAGAVRLETKIVYKQVGRFHVPAAIEETTTVGDEAFGQQTIELVDYRINLHVTEQKVPAAEAPAAASPAPPAQPAPASRPAGDGQGTEAEADPAVDPKNR